MIGYYYFIKMNLLNGLTPQLMTIEKTKESWVIVRPINNAPPLMLYSWHSPSSQIEWMKSLCLKLMASIKNKQTMNEKIHYIVTFVYFEIQSRFKPNGVLKSSVVFNSIGFYNFISLLITIDKTSIKVVDSVLKTLVFVTKSTSKVVTNAFNVKANYAVPLFEIQSFQPTHVLRTPCMSDFNIYSVCITVRYSLLPIAFPNTERYIHTIPTEREVLIHSIVTKNELPPKESTKKLFDHMIENKTSIIVINPIKETLQKPLDTPKKIGKKRELLMKLTKKNPEKIKD